MDWFTSDLHLGHFNIIRYCKRPFSTVEEMDNTIIDNINDRVSINDTLYIMGDFAFTKERSRWFEVWREYRNRIHCKHVVLVCGNHDPHYRDYGPKEELLRLFDDACLARLVRIPYDPAVVMPWENPQALANYRPDRPVYLHHYACRVWPHSHHGAWMGFGHSHGTLPDDPHSLSLDVGIDAVAQRLAVNGQLLPENYRPVDINDIATWMSQKQYSPPFQRSADI